MEDLDKKIIELMDLFDDEQVTTADKIDRPERAIEKQAIDDFMKRNPMAGGGMLVQPSADGSRPGYAKQKDVGKKLVTLKELSELDFPISEVTLKQVFTAKDTNKAYKKIFKDNGIKVVKKGSRNALLFEIPTKNQIDGVWKDTIELVQSGKATVPEKMRTPFKNEVLKIFDEFSKTDTPFSTSDIYYKLVENVQDNPRIYIPKKLKGGTRVPGDTIKTALGKDKAALLMDGNLQRIEKTIGNRKKLVDILSKGKSDINTLSKTLGINKKNLFAEADILFDDLYRYTRSKVKGTGFGEKYGYLKNFDVSDYKNILNNLRASGFEKLDERSMRALITEAYAETDKGKFKAAVNRLNEYTKTNAQLKQLFGFEFQLDHPLSFQALKDLKNVSPENLLRVNPIPAQLNRIKIGLDGTYRKIINNIRQGDSTPELLNQKKAIETLSSKLGIGEFKIDNTGRKVLSFGADPFLKTSLLEKMGQNIFLQDRIAKNLKNINPNLFTEALGERSKVTKSIQKLKPMEPQKVKGLKSFMKANNIKCIVSKSNGGPVTCDMPQAYEKSLNELSTKAQAGDQAAAAKMTNFAKSVRGAGSVIKGVLGPAALVFEAGIAVPLGLFEYSQGKPATEIVDSLTYGLFGKSREDRLKEQMPAYGQVENLQNIDQRIQNLERLQEGTRGQKLRSKPKFEKAKEEFQTAAEPFLSLEDPTAAMLQNLKESENLRQKLIDEDLQRKQERKTPFDLSDPFMAAKGGRAGFKSGALRKGIQALIDKSVKSTPKDTTPDLDALIKRTLDEDFFDKKDRIIDNINLKIARARTKGLDSQEIGEGQIEFYDDITKSNFKTKTGPFFDRRKKAGGGILKQAGDSSGPPPESGPNPQGLQGLMKRGIKT
jgi:hypothetical protein